MMIVPSGTDRDGDLPRRPNVLFIVADQWRAQATGYAGYPNSSHAPALDSGMLQKAPFDTAKTK